MAFAAVGALIGGISAGTAITAGMVLAAVAEVGMALTVVGAVTGSKSLMKIGGAMSLVGGVGGMIAGAAGGAAGGAAAAGAAGEASGISLEASSLASGVGEAGEAASMLGSEVGSSVGAVGEAGLSSAGDLAAGIGNRSIFDGAMGPAAAPVAPVQAATPTAEMSGTAARSVTDVVAPAGAQGPAGAQAPVTPADYDVGGRLGPDNMDVGGGWNPRTATAPEDSGSFFGKLSTFAERNKSLFSSGLQLAGGAMKGANERAMWNEKMELDRQALAQKGYGNQVARFQPRGIVQGAAA